MGAVTTGQFLTDAYVQKMKPEVLEDFRRKGFIVKSSTGKYEITNKGVPLFANCGAKTVDRGTAIDGIDLGQTLGLQKSRSNAPDPAAPQEHTFQLTDIFERLSINGENDTALQTEFTQLLTNAGITINAGEFTFKGTVADLETKLKDVANTFVTNHKDKFVAPEEGTVEFDQDNTSSSVITNLTSGDTPAITPQEDSDRYIINNRQAVEQALPTSVGVNYEDIPAGDSNAVRTVTLQGASQPEVKRVTPEGLPEGNDGTKISATLRDDKDARKKLEASARAAYTTWADAPENQDAVTLYVAANRYGKKVDARVRELSQGETHAFGTDANGKPYSISKEYNISGGEVLDLFLKRLPADQREKLNNNIQQFIDSIPTGQDKSNLQNLIKEVGLENELSNLMKVFLGDNTDTDSRISILKEISDKVTNSNLNDEQKNQLLTTLEKFNNGKIIENKMKGVLQNTYENINTAFEGSNADMYKEEAAKLLLLDGLGLKPSDLLHMLAVNDVMGARTPEQIESDKKYFIEHQSKDYVRNMQAQQDIQATTVHFSKKARKAGTSGIHTDIGNRGRDLVRQAPQLFCDRYTGVDGKALFDAAKGTDEAEEWFTATDKKTGETVYFKFNSQKYKDFMELACDPNASFDPIKAQKLKDLNMTLDEGRKTLELNVLTNEGHMASIVNLLGNNNGKVDNSELNAWRHMAEKAGLSTDGNPTYMKRLGDFAKKLAINGALVVGGGLLGNFAGGLLNIANSTLPQVIQQPDKYFTTPDQTYNVNQFRADITASHEPVIVPGDKFDYNINIDGVEYPMSFEGPDKYILVGNDKIKLEGEFTIKGETYKVEQDDVHVPGQNPGINLVKLGAVTAVTTGIGWLINDRDKIHAQGRANDDLFDPTVYTPSPSVDRKVTLDLPQFRRVETRTGEVQVNTEPIIHQYTTVIAGVKQELMACYPEATEADYAQILDAVAKANGIEGGNATGKLWAGRYTDASGKKHNGIYVPPTITLTDGRVIEYKDEHTTATRTGSGGRGNHYDVRSNHTSVVYKAKAQIR